MYREGVQEKIVISLLFCWPLSKRPIAAQRSRGRGVNILKFFEKTTIFPEHSLFIMHIMLQAVRKKFSSLA